MSGGRAPQGFCGARGPTAESARGRSLVVFSEPSACLSISEYGNQRSPEKPATEEL